MNVHERLFSKIGFNYLTLGILALICQIIVLNIVNFMNPEYLSDFNIVTCISSFCNYILPFPIFYLLMKKISATEPEKRSLNARTFILYLGITFTLMWIGNLIGLAITELLRSAMQNDIANPVHQLINSTDIWLNLFLISIIAPIFEEIMFRKLIIDRTIKYGAKVSIILSAVIFALFHGNLNQFFYTLLMGGFFAYIYIKTGKITYTIILHAIINLMGSVVSLIIASSVENIQASPNPLDGAIIIAYFIVLFTFIVIGVYGLSNFKKARFNGSKTEIGLKTPFKTVFLNYGMVFFILFFIFEMVYQVLG